MTKIILMIMTLTLISGCTTIDSKAKKKGSPAYVYGGRDPRDIREKLINHLPVFQLCYQNHLDQVKKKYQAEVILDFKIKKDGKVYQTKVFNKEQPVPKKLKDCIEYTLKKIQFSTCSEETEVIQPVRLFTRKKEGP